MSHRTIVESDLFSRKRPLIDPDYQRLDEFLEHAQWALLRDPTDAVPIEDGIWKLNLSIAASGDSVLALYYAFNDSLIVFLDLRAEPFRGF